MGNNLLNFAWDNIFLICVVFYCIGALLWPTIRKGARISHSTATAMINKGKTVIFDVRSQKEYKSGHLINAINIPYDTLEDRLPQLDEFKPQQVIVVCHDGKQARSVAGQLRDAGFKMVFSLDGGMEGWRKNGLPITH